MNLALFARGVVLGFSIAAVVGPIGLLCIRRTLVTGFAIGFVSGLGAATADATYAAVASLGISALAWATGLALAAVAPPYQRPSQSRQRCPARARAPYLPLLPPAEG